MRLTKLKLAGFKSFVDPTTVLVPGQLVGVVGPNGCGKSNIIDAVRWVLGESKATALRGESMQDVIFNGSGTRKPVGRASVELVFDNALGRAAGQWSQYAEIAVKRVLDRNGNSSYYLNNLQVRRRDVIDVFLGTGLGPRAYAIIEQGMISRIIEAKPEELRLFLEEAAGVTKYKERRRETENRLSDARENLLRVEDIRNELDTQVVRLEAQAEVARRFHELKSRHDRRQQLLWLKKRNDARADYQRLHQEADAGAVRLEAETARLRELEARVETARAEHFAASDALHAAQGEMYTANAEISRLETEIAHTRDLRQKLEARLIQLTTEDAHWKTQITGLETEAGRWLSLLENARLRAETSQARHEEAAARLPQAEDALRSAGEAVAAARRTVHEAEQGVRLGEANRSHALRALENHAQRRARLDIERMQLGQPDPALLAASQEAQASAEEALQVRQEQLGELQARLPDLEQQQRAARERLQQAHRALAETRARRDALQQLQARVEKNGGAEKLAEWLARRGLADAAPLWRLIDVEVGWETAVEAVLRERLAALAATPENAAQALLDPPPTLFALALPGMAAAEGERAAAASDSLRAKVRCSDPGWSRVLDEWLAGVTVAENLAALASSSASLTAGQCRVDREGHLLSRHGLVLYVPDARTHGVIERQRELEELAALLERRVEDEALASEAQTVVEQALAAAQSQLGGLRREVQEAQSRAHAAQVEALKLTQAQARFEERAGQIERDLAEINAGEENERMGMMRAEEEGADSREKLELARVRLEEALALQATHEAALREARSQEQALAREAQEVGFTERECAGKLEDNARAKETARQQLERIAEQKLLAEEERGGISDEAQQERLQVALAGRREYESLLAAKRDLLESAAATLREHDEQRLRIEQGLDPLRERINELRLKAQAAQLNEEQYAQRLIEVHVQDEAAEAPLLAELAATPNLRENAMVAEINRLQQEIDALGPVNLAALEELTTASERKGFLDAQSADLNQAIGTLESAIRRIDGETREQLQQTYDTVNNHFGTLFPQLFGGGEARLIMTGEEILDAGVQVMAQPPGKKNSSIHLLSGGEKALTATALVFAMFQLNPAPFCLLDEVDAPLDDTNTERFCNMVKRMSAQTQFLFISHNKIAMEMAEQLVGVTMQEQGVSRVVEVDMEEALRMTDGVESGLGVNI
ncbi:chromosome segregation protein SMC [Sterolibacterium denitrificans]|uniref:chromosome segregation protein SMC n=1 Tax=Sterolibacterium denitrificans TaxID=157592 RepID=UPI0012B6940D|nr:chromosome segregation protein SMC [Sterolibacterium denitrificans]